jgi:hypothetical protein
MRSGATTTSSKRRRALLIVRWEIFSWISATSKPGVPRSTRNAPVPARAGLESSVQAKTRYVPASAPLEMKRFSPLRTQRPSRR